MTTECNEIYNEQWNKSPTLCRLSLPSLEAQNGFQKIYMCIYIFQFVSFIISTPETFHFYSVCTQLIIHEEKLHYIYCYSIGKQ